ncbi:MAG TPA: tetratricopeptide repeat protein [Candidatus Aminicenantes bacterium]|nr:tetratricopeptide repeat protein [Candidatus Aminicenantes bacterium]HRY63988.1 tetratricopeptide repeat protein [Candidatus Aminicenantes bacterium]HRZ70901.1 tetratricopeptide repeat protein [Candidatus Aminicenantes bacterium]
MKKILFALAAAALLAVPTLAQTAADHILEGDAAYAAFDDAKALEHYQAALALEPENGQALWKASRAMVDIADIIPAAEADIKARQAKLYGDATALARKAAKASPNDTWAHFQLAAANGKRLLMLGKKEQINASKEVRTEIDKALELDATNHLAWHALGRWHRRMAEIGGAKRFFGGIIYGSIPKGSFAESEKSLRKAIELQPEYVNHYYELGLTLLELKRADEAKQCFEKALALPKTTSKDDFLKGLAQAELDKLKKK